MRIAKDEISLDPRARRCDLTTRELASLLGALISGLCENASVNDVRDAVRWWAETDSAWRGFEQAKTFEHVKDPRA
jgi:hypothetical protein